MNKYHEILNIINGPDTKYVKINDICKTVSPKNKIKSKNYLKDGKYPVVDQGQSYISGYTNEEGTYPKDEYVIFGDHTCVVKYIDFEFMQGADGVKVLKCNEDIVPKYLYYCMTSINIGGEYARHWSKMKEKKIPLPSKEVQKEIVDMFNIFTDRNKKAADELELRQSQFDCIKCQLLKKTDNSVSKSLNDSCFLEKGKTPIQKAVPGKYPLVVTAAERKSNDTFQFDKPSVCVPLVSSRGHGVASLNQVFYQEGEFAVGNILCVVTPKESDKLNAKYLYYYLNFVKDSKIVTLMKGGANVALTVDSLKKVLIDIPPIEVQYQIIGKLEKFDMIIENIKKEIDLLEKQYKYYRDLLLCGKEVESYE